MPGTALSPPVIPEAESDFVRVKMRVMPEAGGDKGSENRAERIHSSTALLKLGMSFMIIECSDPWVLRQGWGRRAQEISDARGLVCLYWYCLFMEMERYAQSASIGCFGPCCGNGRDIEGTFVSQWKAEEFVIVRYGRMRNESSP